VITNLIFLIAYVGILLPIILYTGAIGMIGILDVQGLLGIESFTTALNGSCTLFSLGLYKSVLKKDATEAEVVKSGKTFGWVVAIAAMLIAPLLANTGSIFGYLQKMNGMYFVPPFDQIVATMHEFHFLGVVFAYLVITMLVIGEMQPSESEFVQQDVQAVDMTPWKHAKICGLILIAVVILIYALFADFSVLGG